MKLKYFAFVIIASSLLCGCSTPSSTSGANSNGVSNNNSANSSFTVTFDSMGGLLLKIKL